MNLHHTNACHGLGKTNVHECITIDIIIYNINTCNLIFLLLFLILYLKINYNNCIN
jgi:hypothetical protein